MMREHLKIVKTDILRDTRLEKRVMDYNRESLIYYMAIVGAALILYAFIW